jgi:hypothetical protein
MGRFHLKSYKRSWQTYNSCLLIPLQNFATFSASSKKQLLRYVASAKRPETRQKRIAQIMHAAAQNKNPLAQAASKK